MLNSSYTATIYITADCNDSGYITSISVNGINCNLGYSRHGSANTAIKVKVDSKGTFSYSQ